MDELEFDGKKYLSSKRAAEVTGYAKDYVGQLCREGRVDARLVGRAWYVSADSIQEHRFGEVETKEEVEPQVPAAPVEEEPTSAWNLSSYAAEDLEVIPILAERPVVEVFTEDDSSSIKASPVHHMQAVWQDWFDKNERVGESTEVTITKIPEHEETEREDVPVPIYRIPMREEVAAAPQVPTQEEVRRPVAQKRAAKVQTGGASFIVQALLVALMLLVVSMTFISFGYGTDVFHFGANPVVDYISGISK